MCQARYLVRNELIEKAASPTKLKKSDEDEKCTNRKQRSLRAVPLERRVSLQKGQKVSEQFKREPRYVVFKIKDIHAYLSAAQIDALQTARETIAAGRAIEGKPPFNAVVVEQDWPEFEPTWEAIEARMTANV